MLVEYTCFSALVAGLYVSYVLATEDTLFGIFTHILYKKYSLLVFGNALASLTGLLISTVLHSTLGRVRDLEAQAMSELARNILLDTVLFLLMASPTVRGEDVPHSILISCLGLTIATKIVHLLGSSRVVHTAETGRSWSSIRKLTTLLFTLVLWDLGALYIYLPRANKKSTFYAWILFEFCGFLCSAMSSLLKLVVLCVDMSLEGDLYDTFESTSAFSPLAGSLSGRSPFQGEVSPTPESSHPAPDVDATPQVETEPVRSGGGWPFKTEHYMLIDALKESIDLVIYSGFLLVFCISNPARLPLYLATDLLQVCRSLYNRIHSFRQYRKLIEVLQDTEQFPNANPSLVAERETCIICRDVLTPNSKTLPCGHVLHINCLKSWFISHQTCPTCRTEISLRTSDIRGRPRTGRRAQRSGQRSDQSVSRASDTPLADVTPPHSFRNRPSQTAAPCRPETGGEDAEEGEDLSLFCYPGEKTIGQTTILPPSFDNSDHTAAAMQLFLDLKTQLVTNP